MSDSEYLKYLKIKARRTQNLCVPRSTSAEAVVLNRVSDCLVQIDGEQRIVFLNEAAEKTFGIPSSEAVGKGATEVFLPSFGPDVTARILKSLKLPTVSRCEIHSTALDQWLSVSVSPCAQGKWIVLRKGRDADAAQTIGRPPSSLRSLAAGFAAPAIYVNGEFAELNPAAEKMTGYRREQIAELKVWFALLYRERAREVRDLYEAQRAIGFPTPLVMGITRKDGSQRYVEFSGHVQDEEEIWVFHDVSEMIEGVRAIRERKQLFRSLAENMPHYVWRTNADGKLDYANPQLLACLNTTLDEARNLGWIGAAHPDDAQEVIQRWKEACENKAKIECFTRVRRASDSQYRWMYILGTPMRNDDGRLLGWVGTWTDVHDQTENRRKLEQVKFDLEAAEQLAGTGSWRFKLDTEEAEWSPQMFRIYGYAPDEVPPSMEAVLNRVPPDDHEVIVTALQAAAHEGKSFEIEHRVIWPDGSLRHVICMGQVRATDSRIIGSIIDVTERGRAERELRENNANLESLGFLMQHQANVLAESNVDLEGQATMDALTGIGNRRAYEDHLAQEVRRAGLIKSPLSLILIDVDRFKAFNDQFGHLAGDKVLKQVAQAMAGCVEGNQFLARYGGEEFVFIIPGQGVGVAAEVAERLREAVASGDWPDRPVTISLGVTEFIPGEAGESMVLRADEALYRSKEEGRNRVTTSVAESAKLSS